MRLSLMRTCLSCDLLLESSMICSSSIFQSLALWHTLRIAEQQALVAVMSSAMRAACSVLGGTVAQRS